MIKGVHFREDGNEIDQAVQRLKRLKNSADTCNFEHVCRPDLCNPINDARAPHVYVCDYGQTHVCLPGTCTLGLKTMQGEVVCPVSGLMLGVEESYTMKPEQQHWHRVKPQPTAPKQALLIAPLNTVKAKCEHIVHVLLFGKDRERINGDAQRKQAEHLERQLTKYLTTCTRQGTFICKLTQECIKSSVYVSGKQPYAILNDREHAEDVARAVHDVCQVWKHLLEPFYRSSDQLYKCVDGAPFRPNAECLVVALLYMMKTGSSNGLIPQNLFLSRHLPREKDLPVFVPDAAR